jgi:hypothetical protein
VNALWRALTGTRTMRSAAAEFGPPPGARYADDLARYSDAELVAHGKEILADVTAKDQNRQLTAGRK